MSCIEQEKDKVPTAIIVWLVLIGLTSAGLLISFSNFLGFGDGARAARAEAVERGFAEWVPDKEGNTTFRWKEVAK